MSIIDLGRAENNNLDRIAIIHDRETERRKHRVSLIPFDEIKLGAEAREEFGHEAVKIAHCDVAATHPLRRKLPRLLNGNHNDSFILSFGVERVCWPVTIDSDYSVNVGVLTEV